jgi:hypothetical protein
VVAAHGKAFAVGEAYGDFTSGPQLVVDDGSSGIIERGDDGSGCTSSRC